MQNHFGKSLFCCKSWAFVDGIVTMNNYQRRCIFEEHLWKYNTQRSRDKRGNYRLWGASMVVDSDLSFHSKGCRFPLVLASPSPPNYKGKNVLKTWVLWETATENKHAGRGTPNCTTYIANCEWKKKKKKISKVLEQWKVLRVKYWAK